MTSRKMHANPGRLNASHRNAAKYVDFSEKQAHSALVLGGILVGEEGIIFNFKITCAMQIIATIPLIQLFHKVPAEGDSHSR